MSRIPFNRVQLFLAALLVLTSITWGIGLLDIQYQSEKPLAFDNEFPGDTAQWKLAGDPTNLSLTNHSLTLSRVSENRSYAMRQFPLPTAEELANRQLRVRGEIKTLQRPSRTAMENVAAYMIWFQDKNDETIQYTTVQTLTGDFNHYRAERIVAVPSESVAFIIALINRESDGTFELTDANVSVVETTLLYQLISPAVFISWGVLSLLAIVWLVINGGYKLGVVVGLFLTLTFFGILMPESVTSNYVFPAYKKLAKSLSLGHSEPLGIYYKIGHFMFFFALTLMLTLNRQRLHLSPVMILLLTFVFAVATEGLQLHLYNRSTRLTDIGIDIAGVVLAIFIGLGITSIAVKTTHTDDD